MSVDSAVDAVRRAGGVARTKQLRKAGVAKSDLSHAVREKRLLRPRNGAYVLPDASAATIEALSHCGAVACITAAQAYGLWILDEPGPDEVHTWVRPGHRTTRVAIYPEPDDGSCCLFHRDHPLGEPELGRVAVAHCLIQLYRCRGEETFFAALESALRQGLIEDAARARLREHLPMRGRWLVDFARTDADSGLESLLRLRLHKHGIELASQVSIPGVGQVDFVLGDCLILEADGRTHDGPARHRDRMRDAVAMALGFVTLRFDYAMIIHDWPVVESAVLAAVARNLHRSTAGLTW